MNDFTEDELNAICGSLVIISLGTDFSDEEIDAALSAYEKMFNIREELYPSKKTSH